MTDLVPIQSVLVSSGDALDLDPNVDLVVTEDIFLVSSDPMGFGINAPGSNNITLYGTVVGNMALQLEGPGNVTVRDTARIYGDGAGIELTGSGASVSNSGSIAGSIAVVTRSAATITNTGSIVGNSVGIGVSFAPGTVSINNTGLIESKFGTYAIYSSGSSRDVVKNSGWIVGDVFLNLGNDSYDGRGGTLTGTVYGGGGNDVVFNGKDGGIISGDAGRDHLYGSTGKDVFAFTSHAEADYDTIHTFDVKHDLIQLSAANFDGLVAGKPATFSIGTKASSTADHLFYNSASGCLYYDADGSHAADKPELVARMDKGLALLASDFKIV